MNRELVMIRRDTMVEEDPNSSLRRATARTRQPEGRTRTSYAGLHGVWKGRPDPTHGGYDVSDVLLLILKGAAIDDFALDHGFGPGSS
jgi:hypothetical protein